jgi:serine/threonine protein kinase
MSFNQLEKRARSRLGTMLRDKYRLDDILGVGGMAVVYKATHRNQAKLAVKMLHPELSLNDDVRTRFLREGYAANIVRHSGAVLVVDDEVAEDGAAFLVMEFLDGLSCDKLVSRHGGRLPLDVTCAVALETLDVLAAAHEAGVIHRDIKPANLFVTRDGRLKVLDFGIARVRHAVATVGDIHATATGVLIGTPAFMSPELAVGSDIDARADLWALGATMYTLLSGTLVHEADSGQGLLVKRATQRARSLAQAAPGVPANIVAVVDRALAFDKADRWATTTAMRGALAAAYRSASGALPSRTVLQSLFGSTAKGDAVAAAVDTSPPHVPLEVTLTAGAIASPSEPPLLIAETGRPVSRDGNAAKRRGLGAFSPAAIVAGIIAVAGIAVVGALVHFSGRDKKRSSAEVAAQTASAIATDVAAQHVSAPPPVESPREADASGQVARPAHTTGISAAALKDASHPALPPTAPPPTGAGTHTSPVANCNPNYWLDANGEKRFKRECFK